MFAIRAHELAKSYKIGSQRAGYDTLRDELARAARRLVGTRSAGPRRETIWALDGVSFEIAQGEVVGILGRNGAGKTTLLRILSRVTEPTKGYADIRGRLGTLLEVGTGFHPELTGRENVLLNGAILGMRRGEVMRKFDEIVEFAGVEKFIDTPVKRYSSGMSVRLAFSVAAHLEPEVMLVDEVLAVGDAEFQKRCLGRLDEIGQSGRTVLFVSHSMQAVARLCGRALLLDSGRLVEDGSVEDVIASYLSGAYGTSAEQTWAEATAPGNEFVRIRSIRVIDTSLRTTATINVREQVGVEITLDVLSRQSPPFVPWLALFNEQNAHVFSAIDTSPEWRERRRPGRYTSVAWIPENLLNEGTMSVSISLNTFAPHSNIRQAHVDAAVSFQVVDSGEGDTARGHYAGAWPGPVRPLLNWTTECVDVSRPLGVAHTPRG